MIMRLALSFRGTGAHTGDVESVFRSFLTGEYGLPRRFAPRNDRAIRSLQHLFESVSQLKNRLKQNHRGTFLSEGAPKGGFFFGLHNRKGFDRAPAKM